MSQDNIEKIKEYCHRIFREDNIRGGIFNLFYEAYENMEEYLHMNGKSIDVVENLKTAKELIEKYNIIPKSTNYILGIEGLDHIKDIDEIDKLYEIGLRSTNIVWNNPNKFGGGTKADPNMGLTELGKQLVEKLVKKHIAIDLSHTNEKTFYGIIEECRKLKSNGNTPIIHSSHSNAKAICDVPRNLTDEQIKIIANEFNGTIGIVEYTPFIKERKENETFDLAEYEKCYINHINHIKKLLGNIENIAVSTDDMTFEYNNPDKRPIYKHEEVGKKLKELLENN
jgi:membrane dipeptidase